MMKEEYHSGGTRDRGRRQERDRFDRRSRSGSKSPLRSKVSVVGPLMRGRDKDRRERSRSRSDRGSDKFDRKNKSRNADNRGRLRMDESRSFRNEHDYRDKEVREDRNISLKRNSNSVFADLDRAVKKAREERNTIGYWNKKVIEVEEKDPNRWGHSGFKEMYHSRDIDVQRSNKNPRRSRSGSRDRTDSKMLKRTSDRRQVGRKSRSRSPMLKQLHKARERQEAAGKIKPLLPKGFLTSRSSVKTSGSRHGHKANSSAKIRPLLGLKTETPPRRLNAFRSRKSSADRGGHGHKGHSSNYASRNDTGGKGKVKSAVERPRQRLGPPPNKRNHDRRSRSPHRRSSSSLSRSRSESAHSRTPSPQLKRLYKSDLKSRSSNNRSDSKSRSRSRSHSRQRSRRSRSRSLSSSSNSSEDEDVLELHPRRRRSRSYSISRSDSSSSDNSSASGARRSDPKRRRTSRSTSSNTSSGSDTDHSMAMAKDKDRSARNNIPSPIPKSKTVVRSGHSANGQPPARVGNKTLTPGGKPSAQAVKGKAVTASKAQILGSKPQTSPAKRIVTPAQKKETVAAAAAQPGKKVVPVKKAPVPTGKQTDASGKQPAPAGKQSTAVTGSKPPSQTARKPSQAVPPTKQAPPASKQPVQSGKQPTKTPPSATKQKVAGNSSTTTNTRTAQSEKNRKQIHGPSDIDSDSSGDDEIGSNNSKRASDKGKSGDKGSTSKKNGKASPAGSKEEGESGSIGSSSDSASDSSSDSESEPRMTLSERFAKLTQMNTDKREFAKPVLSVNEIDTKLKVVKDLRGPTPDTKVYVDGQQPQRPNSGSWSSKSRPKSPEFAEGEDRARYPSAERRRHFERMSLDAPSERPADWSDITVRYNYYRDRGCFDERPLTLDEYSKWEAWYYEYKMWLENEERINQQMMQEQQGLQMQEQEFGIGSRLGRRGILGDHPERTVRSMSSRLEQRIVRSAPDNRPYYDRDNSLGNIRVNDRFARRIGHAPSGSLVVNIRQENNFGGRQNMQRGGRRVGLQRN